jgi:hypothetical protein
MQVTSFDDEDTLNEFLALHKWRLDDIRLQVTHIPDTRSEQLGRAPEMSRSFPMTRYYLLHPVVKQPLGQ